MVAILVQQNVARGPGQQHSSEAQVSKVQRQPDFEQQPDDVGEVDYANLGSEEEWRVKAERLEKEKVLLSMDKQKHNARRPCPLKNRAS